MGQQHRKVVKRIRRKNYLERCKAKIRASISKSSKKK